MTFKSRPRAGANQKRKMQQQLYGIYGPGNIRHFNGTLMGVDFVLEASETESEYHGVPSHCGTGKPLG